MKKQLLTLIALSSFFYGASAQNFKEDPNYIKKAPNAKGYMLDTVSTSSLTKQQLYSNALSFLSDRFKDSRSVVESKDLELGEISFNGNNTTSIIKSDTTKRGKISNYQWKIALHFKCKLYLKDNKFKIVLNALKMEPMIGMGTGLDLDPGNRSAFTQENKAASDLALSLIKDLSASLNKKPENDF